MNKITKTIGSLLLSAGLMASSLSCGSLTEYHDRDYYDKKYGHPSDSPTRALGHEETSQEDIKKY